MVVEYLAGEIEPVRVQEAVQRVYINIGSCSETCWENHLTNFFVLDPNDRGFGQTPLNIGQCRRDCPNFRAIEDRLPDIAAFLLLAVAAWNFFAVGRERRSTGYRLLSASVLFWGLLLLSRQFNRDRRSLSLAAADIDCTTMIADDLINNGEPQSRAAGSG